MQNQLAFILFLSFLLLSSCRPDKEARSSPISSPSPNKEIIKSDASSSSIDDDDKRMSWQKPNDVINALGDITDKVIVDLGAGIGYFSFKMLPRCERVIAVDIDSDKIQILNGFKNSLDSKLANSLDIRLAEPEDPNLNPKEADIILIVNTVAYLSPRVEYLAKLKGYLKEGGKVFIVDFKNKRLPDYANAPSFDERVYMHVLEEQLEAAGYRDIKVDDTTLDFQYLVQASL